SPPALSPLGEVLARLGDEFTADVALGLVAVDAGGLEEIEHNYGGEAQQRALDDLGVLVQELVSPSLGVADAIVTGETGRSEILIFLFRDASEVDFYQRELPELHRVLADAFERRGHRIGYPYLRASPELPVGTAAALRNPTIRAETQIRAAIEEARREARLEATLATRRRRRRLFELVLQGRVRSVYEPIVDVTTRTVFAYEALARGPEGSELHSPAALFASASEQDLLFQLDCLCRRSALDGARDLPGGAKLFVNVRPTTIHDPSFRADALSRTLEKCKLRPSDVVFEISEQESIGNFEIFREVRDYYGELGFQIALDDVGAAYASLEAVLELTPEFIKVDRAFVKGIDQDPGRQELLRALSSVADRLNARIIAEGLDKLEELETLAELGIPLGQGWLFGKATPLRADVSPV
ncbi:MAG: EAL domain-containing protein, partial [Myxococcota bacterium]